MYAVVGAARKSTPRGVKGHVAGLEESCVDIVGAVLLFAKVSAATSALRLYCAVHFCFS